MSSKEAFRSRAAGQFGSIRAMDVRHRLTKNMKRLRKEPVACRRKLWPMRLGLIGPISAASNRWFGTQQSLWWTRWPRLSGTGLVYYWTTKHLCKILVHGKLQQLTTAVGCPIKIGSGALSGP